MRRSFTGLAKSIWRRGLGKVSWEMLMMSLRTFAYRAYFFKISHRQFLGLNLGSGPSKIKGFLNLDASPYNLPDILAQIDKIKLRSNSVSIIYASHVFEHIPRAKTTYVLAEWYRVLKAGGKLYISVPDIEFLFKTYLENIGEYFVEERRVLADRAIYLIYGGQHDRWDVHYNGYSFVTLKTLLESIGFRYVQRYDRAKLEFAPPNDISTARIDGLPISLNVEGQK
jgi:predicted SAM-dependent methyltransferase